MRWVSLIQLLERFLQLSLDGVNFETIPGTNVFTYHKATNFGSGTASSTHILSVAPNNKIRLRTARFTGSDTLKALANACSITITQL